MALVKYNLNGNMVEYDDSEFEVLKNDNNVKYLHYIGAGNNVRNPKGNTSCYKMFEHYKGTSLDLSNFDTSKVTSMDCMFAYCENLKILNLKNFNTEKVVDMIGMFYNCKKLMQINLSSFNINNTENLDEMFKKCESLKELDISNFHFTKDKKIIDMFWGCGNLKKLKIDSNFFQIISKSEDRVFYGCENVTLIVVNKLDKVVQELFY